MFGIWNTSKKSTLEYTLNIIEIPEDPIPSAQKSYLDFNITYIEDFPCNKSLYINASYAYFNSSHDYTYENCSDLGNDKKEMEISWWALVAVLVVLLTAMGNVLVILAISMDRRLQNMTNYFLMSLAATDLMVAVFVMPVAILVLMLGHFPFSSNYCLLWISLDVLFCSASIMHLCTISVDRFLSLRYPMRFGRHKTRRRVILKLVLVWCLSLSTSLPLFLMYVSDSRSTIVDGVCQIPVSLFQIVGSVFAFYVPLVIMVSTYALTVRLLCQKESELMAAVVDTPVTPLSNSIRLKRLLCKTTSTISSATATSIADPEVPDHNVDSEISSSPNKRRPFARYATHYRTQNPKVQEIKGHNCRRSPNLSNHLRDDGASSNSMAISPYSSGTPERKSNSLHFKSNKKPLDHSYSATQTVNGSDFEDIMSHQCDPPMRSRRKSLEHPPNERHLRRRDTSDLSNINGTVSIPCSCAPRFFLEGFADSNNRETNSRENNYRKYSADTLSDTQSRTSRTAGTIYRRLSRTLFNCRGSEEESDPALNSPWHENQRSPPRAKKLISRQSHRGGQVIQSFASNISGTPAGKSTRHDWRTRSCSASIRFVTSKRHGRNIRMEQKATKVLGIVFFTFVVLWSPFFIINITLGVCPSCQDDFSDGLINLVTWLGYISSTVNPFFYTFFNKSFREAFVKIIKCKMKLGRKYHF